jgi:hypothetical protein
LNRNPDKRYGSKEVKNHPFFADINWDKLERREIDPPFKPGVKSKTDVSQIDPMFTNKQAIDSVVENSTLADSHFDGFTFVSSNVMDGQ